MALPPYPQPQFPPRNNNSSATGGPLFPQPPDANTPLLEGAALVAAIQAWVVGLSGLGGALVRPAFQEEPGDIPSEGDVWIALRLAATTGDRFPYIEHDGEGAGADRLTRNEDIECLLSCYDLGITGLADRTARLVRDGMSVPQNREAILPIMVKEVGDMVAVPSLLKSRWLYRVDLPFRLRRAYTRAYGILSLQGFVTRIIVQDPAGNNFYITVNWPPA